LRFTFTPSVRSQAGIPCQIGAAAQIVVSVGTKVGRRRLLAIQRVGVGHIILRAGRAYGPLDHQQLASDVVDILRNAVVAKTSSSTKRTGIAAQRGNGRQVHPRCRAIETLSCIIADLLRRDDGAGRIITQLRWCRGRPRHQVTSIQLSCLRLQVWVKVETSDCAVASYWETKSSVTVIACSASKNPKCYRCHTDQYGNIYLFFV